MQDLTIDKFTEISKNAGGLIILLPKNLVELSQDQRDQIHDLEKYEQKNFSSFLIIVIFVAYIFDAIFRFMLDHQDLTIPVYFLKHSEEFENLIRDISNNQASTSSVTSALNEILDKVSANIYQVVVSGTTASPRKDSKVMIVQGELLPFKPAVSQIKEDSNHNKLPVIVVNVGFKHFGIANLETSSYDTTIFLTLVDAFSKLYNQMSSAKYKLGQ